MRTYKAFYRGRNIEVEAETSYAAQTKAAALFGKAKFLYRMPQAIIILPLLTPAPGMSL